MAVRMTGWKTSRLLCVFILLGLTQQFEVRDEEWEELGPDIAALHRLRGLSEHMFLEKLETSSNHRESSVHMQRERRSESSVDVDPNPLLPLDNLQECKGNLDFTACVAGKEQDFVRFLRSIEAQWTHDRLISASETAHSYSQKLLVMADEEKSTDDRVQLEYSTDPLHSTIISRECLDGASCVPDADRHTVVKVFGMVSEDGRTVSGLSGSSLAQLMLKPSLEAAPVFSLNGQTSRDFQQDFLSTLKAHGSGAVLETSEGKLQTYQVMDHFDSVSKYQIPQRPADTTTRYDHQHIIILEDGKNVRDAAAYLFEKHPTVSAVYDLDENRMPKLIQGDPVPLSEQSRLVLVGHGGQDAAGNGQISEYKAEDVREIIQKTSRVGDRIQTVSVVACEVGEDPKFVETLTKEVHDVAHIQTELHFRSAVVQVQHTGQKITKDVSREATQWRHKDDSKKVVANVDRNGRVVTRVEPGGDGEAVFTEERNPLMINSSPKDRFLVYRDSWPQEPQRFVDHRVFMSKDSKRNQLWQNACDELEALAWGLFHRDRPLPKKVNANNLQQFVIGEKANDKIRWIEDEQGLRSVLSDCYHVDSAEDYRNIIRHYANTGEDRATHLMVNDWIYVVDPQNLYVYPVGKKLDNNQMGNTQIIQEIQNCINEQIGQEKYSDMRRRIHQQNVQEENREERYVEFVHDRFVGRPTSGLPLSTEAWFTTYFTASVLCESARNFRTFPLVLMALALRNSKNNNIRKAAHTFFFEDHPMARGFSWIDPSRRGFSGSATPRDSSKLHNYFNPQTQGTLMKHLETVIDKEVKLYEAWTRENGQNILPQIMTTAEETHIAIDRETLRRDYNRFKERVEGGGLPRGSGALRGYNDGRTTSQDLNFASGLENSFKFESYFSRQKSLSVEHISSQMRSEHGDDLSGWRIQEGSALMEGGRFKCTFESEDMDPVQFSAKLPPESQLYGEKLSNSLESTIHDAEIWGSSESHGGNEHGERAGKVLGALGLVLGLRGTVRAFEQGDVKDGVMGALQTAHGVVGPIIASAVAEQTLSSESRITEAAETLMKGRALKGTVQVIPLVGVGFGAYYFEQDLERGDTLGYLDAVLDGGMAVLDVVQLVQPELETIIAPVALVVSAVRMGIDDVYTAIQDEESSLPKDAGAFDKLLAALRGFEKGIEHFGIHVASFFYDWHYDDIQRGLRLVEQISDYSKYYTVREEEDGRKTVDFTTSRFGGGIDFTLGDQGPSKFCMDYFVSRDESVGRRCWDIDTQGSQDIILGLGESQQLKYETLQNKVLMIIPVGSETVVSGYEARRNSRYGVYKGNRADNHFIALQKAEDEHATEVMFSYYYTLFGEQGDDIFFLGPQKSHVRGSAGKDTFIIPENGGKVTIDNYDPAKAADTLLFHVLFSHISVSRSSDDVVLMYEGSHTVTVQGWFLGEEYRHMNLMSGDGVLFEISLTEVSSVRLVATSIYRTFQTTGGNVDASEPLLRTVTNMFGSRFDDVLIGNDQNNVMDGAGGQDHLVGGEGEDIYVVKDRGESSVVIENYSTDNKTDVAIIEANLHSFKVRVEGDDVVLSALDAQTSIRVTLEKWFTSAEHRHLFVLTKDLIRFGISDTKADCLQQDPFTTCIRSHSIDYSSSPSALEVDLQKDEALNSVTEVRGSSYDDDIRGNQEHNVLVPGLGEDLLQGRGGEDWYVVTPDQGVKTIDNQSPDEAVDFLILKEEYQHITSSCEGRSVAVWANGKKEVILQNWFDSKRNQHLQIKTSDGITAGLASSVSSCDGSLMSPLTVDYRNQKPEPLQSGQRRSFDRDLKEDDDCFLFTSHLSNRTFCGRKGKMMMNVAESVIEMYGSSGFDIMMGNSNNNLLDPGSGGALMSGGEGKDTYIIRNGDGDGLLIENFAEDQKMDTVLVDVDFLDGGRITLDSSENNVTVTVTNKGDQVQIQLLNYNSGSQYQHVDFQSSDGVSFRLKLLDSDVPSFEVEAFRVTLDQPQVDCRLDLSAQRNLSRVHTVKGCSSRSNNILGNAEDNALFGGWKDDALEGGQGDDTLIGGSGHDLLIGGMGDDTLYGEDGNDTMMGNSGRDIFIPGPGADLVDGGPGRDAVLYRGDHSAGKGVYVNLLTGQGRYADAEGDMLKDVEMVVGTIYADTLVSGSESCLLKGSDGDDVLVSTGGDYLVGDDGSDIYMLAFLHGSVTINNCATDNATDVLYLSSEWSPEYDCTVLSDRLLLTFSTVKITLEGWTGDNSTCGHLKLFLGQTEVSVDELVEKELYRQKEIFWFEYIILSIGIGLASVFCEQAES
ncbi:uncharacterized protein V6R79_021860 [Siganus canaliculatus]